MPDATTQLSKFLYGTLPQMEAGPGGVIERTSTQTATAADTNETDLWTWTLPANCLGENGKILRVTAYGTLGATGNTKTLKPYFGGTVIQSYATTGNNMTWKVVWDVVRISSSSQTGWSTAVSSGSAVGVSNSSVSADLSTALVVKITGTNGTAAANDIVFRFGYAELI